jgi:hypothetical protein
MRNLTTAPVTFHDSRTIHTGDRVRFDTKYCSTGWGTVIGFISTKRDTTVLIQADADTRWGRLDRWPLQDGGWYDRLAQQGVYGGEIYEVLTA